MLKTHLDLREVHTWEFKLNFKKQTLKKTAENFLVIQL